jgi:D-alanyl-D-alanine carboxypeptidase/D-alanyl-D-alanine-endopeptidase (penicillin-binding protein 4)
MPASNLKLIVSATVLDRLGPEFRWRTRLLARGLSPDGRRAESLVLVGGGDPTLLSADLGDLARQAAAAGITKVTGGIEADSSLFDTPPLGSGWAWDYESDYYAARTCALAVNRNTVGIRVTPGRRQGEPAKAHPLQSFPGLRVRCSAVTGAAGSPSTVEVHRRRSTDEVLVAGSIPAEESAVEVDVTVEDPARMAGSLLAQCLEREGVQVGGRVVSGRAGEGDRQMATHDSPPLEEVLKLLNKPSDNLIAEEILSTLGALHSPGKGTLEEGLAEEERFLRSLGVARSDWELADGSGLSRRDQVTPRLLVSVLRHMAAGPKGRLFIDSLPVAGVDGTLKRRMTSGPAQGRVSAKTGTLFKVCALSGYARTAAGEPLAFSLLMNHYAGTEAEVRAIQDRIVTLMAAAGEGPADGLPGQKGPGSASYPPGGDSVGAAPSRGQPTSQPSR